MEVKKKNIEKICWRCGSRVFFYKEYSYRCNKCGFVFRGNASLLKPLRKKRTRINKFFPKK